MNKFEKPTFKKYYPVPPMYESVYEYQDINRDVNMRKQITLFYHEKLLEWIDNNQSFHFLRKNKKQIENNQFLIYKLLRKFVKKSGVNWYDLRDNYSLIKEYLYKTFKNL
jgi:hypothetical protein